MSDIKKVEQTLQVYKDSESRHSPTQSQSDAITHDGPVLVSASAGSGKTMSLIMRLIAEIARGTRLDKILVLTYNVAAGEELKSRLNEYLFDVAARSDGQTRDNFKQAMDDLPFAHIGTTHSFCADLIKRNFEKLDVSPTFEILTDTGEKAYADEALDRTFEYYSSVDDEVFAEFEEVFTLSRGEDSFRSVITDLFHLIDIQPDRGSFFDTVAKCYAPVEQSLFTSLVLDSVGRACKRYISAIDDLVPRLTDCKLDKFADCMQIIRAEAESLQNADLRGVIRISSAPQKLPSLMQKGGDLAVRNQAKQLKKSFSDYLTKQLADKLPTLDTIEKAQSQNKVYVQKLLEVVGRFEQVFTTVKQRRNALTFNDLEHKCVELLHDENERKRIRNDYDALFVDEYQDVNPTQEYIYNALAGANSVFVGDVKQAIYGFRLADPTIFLSREKQYKEGGGHTVEFVNNFRSEESILNFVNRIFDSVMTLDSADVDYRATSHFATGSDKIGANVQVHLFANTSKSGKAAKCADKTAALTDAQSQDAQPQPQTTQPQDAQPQSSLSQPQEVLAQPQTAQSQPQTTQPQGDESGVDVYRLDAHVEQQEDERADESEARFIASEIKRLVGSAKKKDGTLLGYGDVALLFRHKNDASYIIPILQKENVPLDVGSFSSGDAPETELINVLKVIDNPHQDIPLAGTLLSVFGGFGEEEVAEIAEFRKTGNRLTAPDLYDCLQMAAKVEGALQTKVDSALQAKAECALQILARYRLESSFKSVSELMQDLIADFSYDAVLQKRGDADASQIKAFIASIQAMDENSSLSRFLNLYAHTDGDDVSSRTFGGDRVHISTYHGFKGLEIPVVFVSAACKPFAHKDSKDVTYTGNGYIGVRYFDADDRCKRPSLSRFAVKVVEHEKELKEEMRLLYVALTRPQQYLYVTGCIGTLKEGESFAFGQTPCFNDAASPMDFISDAVFNGTLPDISVQHRENQKREQEPKRAVVLSDYDEADFDVIAQSQSFVYPHAESTRMAVKYSVSSLISGDADNVVVAPKSFEARTLVGTLYHRVMQAINFEAKGVEGVETELSRMVADNVLSEDERAQIKPQVIAKLLATPLMDEARASVCEREKAFMMYVPACEVSDEFTTDDKVLVQGIIDLVIVGKKTTIVDFKYSSASADELKKRYKKQLYMYKKAFESSICKKVDAMVLYSFKSGECIQIQ